jgi:hypothetical protein
VRIAVFVVRLPFLAVGVELAYLHGGDGGFGASDEAFAQRVRDSLGEVG